MNLHAIAGPVIGAVNPATPATLRLSTGNVVGASGKPVPSYATPGALVGSIAGNVLTVTAVSLGKLMIGQALAAVGIAAGTIITGYGTGSGGTGTYTVNNAQTLASVAMTTSLTVSAQVQPLTFGDIQQLDGLNIQGTRRAVYFYGQVDGLVRVDNKGGDLVTLADGRIYLVALVLEQWPDWCKCAVTLQDGS